ncbi:MAG: MlaD family protein, partial [Candidatus Adiutrix sp.]|nr:MlaD family protein [Candidatus Adiutrix sp.]
MPHNNYLKIGLFVLAGFGLFIAGLLAFGLRDRLTSTNVRCVTLFNRSVQGLSTDAAVKFRGFAVGRVTSISLAAAVDHNNQPMVRVDFEIDPATLAAQIRQPEEAPDFLRREIEYGL